MRVKGALRARKEERDVGDFTQYRLLVQFCRLRPTLSSSSNDFKRQPPLWAQSSSSPSSTFSSSQSLCFFSSVVHFTSSYQSTKCLVLFHSCLTASKYARPILQHPTFPSLSSSSTTSSTLLQPRCRAMAPPKPLSTELKVQRIHIGGLAPSVTPKDLVQRFSSFGTVKGGEQGVDGLGKSENGTLSFLVTSSKALSLPHPPVGLPRSYAFFNLETTEAKFARCTSRLQLL
jgi:hypothetical protein